MAMVKSDQPFAGISEMMTQNFEQTRKAMEKNMLICPKKT